MESPKTTSDPFRDQIRAAKAEGELAAIKDALAEFAEGNGFNPELEPRELLDKASGAFRSRAAISDMRYDEIRRLKEEIEAMRPRLMPEGMECPRYDDGEPVRIGDVASDVKVRSVVLREDGIILSDCTSVPGWGTWRSYNGPIKRHAPKVLDADGVEIRVGDTVYEVDDGWRLMVREILSDRGDNLIKLEHSKGGDAVYRYGHQLTHRAPVLAVDGRPLREGETVYLTDSPTSFVVDDIMTREDGATVVHLEGGAWNLPQYLTHERPDSWERLEEDANKNYTEYWECDGIPCYYCPAIVDGKQPDKRYNSANCSEAVKCDLVRRAKRLAEVIG